jgi:hypothetical protein
MRTETLPQVSGGYYKNRKLIKARQDVYDVDQRARLRLLTAQITDKS